jgi:hypothetical protein
MVCLAVIICSFTKHKGKEVTKHSQMILSHLILNGHIQVAFLGLCVGWQREKLAKAEFPMLEAAAK